MIFSESGSTKKKQVKLRFSKGISGEKQNYITEIIEKSNSKLIDFRGNVAVIFKKKR